jgi:predicted ATP-grasp superfamily ATP-dependent carboligase
VAVSPEVVLILGASARAAAWSALRAGLWPAAADLFGDTDLAAVAPCLRVDPAAYPDGLIDAAARLPEGPWLYTGALENRPDLIEQLARRRPLLGNGAETVRAVRDPLAVAGALRAAGLPAPEVRTGDPTGLPRDGSWLRKPLASAGGLGIEPLGPGPTGEPGPGGPWYYQQRIDGRPLSAVFVGTGTGASLAGVTLQRLGRPGAPFAYRGNVGPWPLGAEAAARVVAVGDVLAARFGLVGLFGVDFQWPGDGRPWVVEVNPRYTAGVEVLELALGRSLLSDHVAACDGRPPGASTSPGPARRVRHVAREVVFTDTELTFDVALRPGQIAAWVSLYRAPRVGDVPMPGTRVAAGDPVLTVFAEGEGPDDALRRLDRRRLAWEHRLRARRGRVEPGGVGDR